ncbi:MAG: carbon storage regulator CsrA [Caldicoprobacterales bacterium]|jgi:carbon storage regulator
MLVVTRKINEGIVIDEDIEITIVGVEDGKVKLGINAPKDKKIYRKEIFEAIKEENRKAMKIDKKVFSHLPKKK